MVNSLNILYLFSTRARGPFSENHGRVNSCHATEMAPEKEEILLFLISKVRRADTAQTHGHLIVSRYLYCSTTPADHDTHVCFSLLIWNDHLTIGWRHDHGPTKDGVILYLVHGGHDAGYGGGDLVSLLDGRDHRVEVAGGEGLLQGHQHRQQQHKHLTIYIYKDIYLYIDII